MRRVTAVPELLREVSAGRLSEDMIECLCTGEAYAFVEDGRPVAAVGGWDQGGGRVRVWAVMGHGITPRQILRVTKHNIAWIEEALDGRYERVETPVKADFGSGIKWARMLGLQVEALMPKYHQGQDYFLFARVREDG